jgi:hypothetical protein
MHRPTLAVIGAAVVLTLGVGGGSFAAAMITGADIKDGTVTSADIKNQSLRLRDLAPGTVAPRVLISRKGPGSYLPDPPADTVFHSMTVPAGRWLVSVTATAFPHDFNGPNAMAQCSLKAPGSSTGRTTTTIDGGNDYAALATQITVDTLADTSVSFECTGVNSGVNQVTITAVEVSSITDLSP